MNVHKNATSSPRSRALLVDRVLNQGWTMTAATSAIGISERRGWEFLRRYRAEGLAGLQDRSSRPRRCRQTRRMIRRQIERLRRRRMTCRRIAAQVGHSRSTVARVVSRIGLSRLRSLDPTLPIRRYERERPGELVHIDIKKLAQIKGIGHRITGSRRRRRRAVGYEFLHVCIDDRSRLTYAEVLPSERWQDALAFMVRALAWFKALGIAVEQVMTDNGSCYRAHAFRSFCRAIGLSHIRTRPYTPQTNGKAERMIQTLLREWAYRFPFRSSKERIALLDSFLHFYNHHRAHRSLGELPPISRISLNNVLSPNT